MRKVFAMLTALLLPTVQERHCPREAGANARIAGIADR